MGHRVLLIKRVNLELDGHNGYDGLSWVDDRISLVGALFNKVVDTEVDAVFGYLADRFPTRVPRCVNHASNIFVPPSPRG